MEITSNKLSTKHAHYEIWGGDKIPDAEGWFYSTCTQCGQRWRYKTIIEYLPQPTPKEGENRE